MNKINITIDELGKLFNSVLWYEKNKNESYIKELNNLILTKPKLSFSKEEFINEWLFSDEFIQRKNKEDYDEVDEFIFNFFNEMYDAINKKDNTEKVNIKEKINQFDNLIDKYNIDNFTFDYVD